MEAVITGDIINSKESKGQDWLESLKSALYRFGKPPKDWQIYRGDAFQLKTNLEDAVVACFYIKACIKVHASLDVRLAIGIGSTQESCNPITEEQGEAFYRSGNCFESLKLKTLAIETGNEAHNTLLNLLFELGLLTFDTWTSVDAKTVKTALENPNFTQKEMAKMLNKSSSTVNFSLQKAGYKELTKLLAYYKELMKNNYGTTH